MASITPAMNLKFVDEPDKTVSGKVVTNSTTIKSKSDISNLPHGKPKSGRVWKTQKTRFSSFRMTKGTKKSFEKHQKDREQKRHVKLYERELRSKRAQELEAKRKRTEENIARKEANARKAEIVQPIKNTAKLKRMKKKKLRQIEKR